MRKFLSLNSLFLNIILGMHLTTQKYTAYLLCICPTGKKLTNNVLSIYHVIHINDSIVCMLLLKETTGQNPREKL